MIDNLEELDIENDADFVEICIREGIKRGRLQVEWDAEGRRVISIAPGN